MKSVAILVVLIVVLLSHPIKANAQRNGVKDRFQCLLYVTGYDCASCRMSFLDFAKANNRTGDIEYKIAIKFQRQKEFKQFMHDQMNRDSFIEADAEFLKMYPQIKSGDIVLVSKSSNKVRTNIYDKNWEKSLARAIHKSREVH